MRPLCLKLSYVVVDFAQTHMIPIVREVISDTSRIIVKSNEVLFIDL